MTFCIVLLHRDCTDGLRPFAKDILNSCHQALAGGQLKSGEMVRLMYPVGKMLAAVPRDQVTALIHYIYMCGWVGSLVVKYLECREFESRSLH